MLPLESFFMAGFECTYAQVVGGRRLDLLEESRHDALCREDYRLLRSLGIKTVREGLSWSRIDQGQGRYHFDRFETMMRIGQQEGVQQIWDLNHFDYPDYLDPFTEDFPKAFAAYALQTLARIRRYEDGILFLSPLNEISFFSFMGGHGDGWAPFAGEEGAGYQLKRQLVRAALAAMQAIWRVDRNVRFIHADPLMYRLPGPGEPQEVAETARYFNEEVRYQSWDMLSGKLEPELGGSGEFLDVLGINYYLHNQQYIYREERPLEDASLPLDHPARLPFDRMLQEVYARYGRPMLVTETGSVGPLRPQWWVHLLPQIEVARQEGLPLYGVCAYPFLDNRNQEFVAPFSGLYDFQIDDSTCERLPHEETLAVIRPYLRRWNGAASKGGREGALPSLGLDSAA